MRASRELLSEQSFLDQKWDRAGLATASLPFADLPAPRERPRVGMVWHASFCCSTLIASCLDVRGRTLSLKEPRALVDLADLKRRGDLPRLPQLASAVLGLLARRFAPGEQVLVKPSNGANALIEQAAALSEGPVLLLHPPCREFVVSVAKSGESTRGYVRALLATLLADRPEAMRGSPWDMMRLTDLQAAALAWQLQMAVLNRAARALGDRARSLDSSDFLAAPDQALAALDGFFGAGLGPEGLAAVTRGPALRRDAKAGGQFDAEGRAASARAAAELLGEDLDRIVDWSFRAAPWAAPGAALPRPLLG